MTNNDFYYTGFIEACTSRGLDKCASDKLYKQAQAMRLLGKGLGYLFNAARWGGGKVVGFGRGAKNMAGTAGRMAKDVGGVIADVGRSGKAALGGYGRSIASGFKDVVPPVTRLAWAKRLGIGSSKFLPKTWAYITNLKRPFAATMNFVGKHPVIGTLGAMGIGAYLTNKVNQDSMEDMEKSKMPALTPSEKAMYDRYDSGMNLPGLGLDPAYFTGSYYNAYM